MTQRYFEDLPIGFTYRSGEAELTREAIVKFAREWDPQPFHVDDAAAAESHFGTLIASGWHTLLIAFNLAMQSGVWDEASMGASGWTRCGGSCQRFRATSSTCGPRS